MTGWHIEISYNGGGSDEKEQWRWETLKQEARDLSNNPKK